MFKTIVPLVLTILCQTALANSVNQKSLKLLDTPFIFQAPCKNLPPDISYIFADLKFDGEKLQLCELGPGPYTGLTTTPVHVGKETVSLTSPYWELFWHYLSVFDRPMIRIGGWDPVEANKILATFNGKRFTSIDRLSRDGTFYDVAQQQKTVLTDLSKAAGFVVFTHNGTSSKNYKKFILKHPELIFVNHYTNKFIGKVATNTLCKQSNLAPYKPKFKICSTTYTPILAQSIINELNASHYIIKPTASLRGRGIIMVAKEDLDATLKSLFDNGPINKKVVVKANFWTNKRQKQCIIETYAPSKKICVDNTWYDPTMRLVCFLSHNRGTIAIHVVGGYWKTPRYGLHEKCPLTLKHITEAGIGNRFAIAPHDMAIAKKLCSDLMYQLYSSMLTQSIKTESKP